MSSSRMSLGVSTTLAIVLVAAAGILIPRVGIAQSDSLRNHGSFASTALFATAGSLVGIVASSPFVHLSGPCPAVPGAQCGGGDSEILVVVGASLVGAAAGAVVGRHLTHGRQSFVRSVPGAALGGMVGGVVASRLDGNSDATITLAFAIPQGVFAALVGW